MTWRDVLTEFDAAVPASDLADAIGELEATQARLMVRLMGNGHRVPARPEPDPMREPDRLLDVKEAAERLGVKPRWLYEHADDYRFTRRLGRRKLRFSERGLEQYISGRR